MHLGWEVSEGGVVSGAGSRSRRSAPLPGSYLTLVLVSRGNDSEEH